MVVRGAGRVRSFRIPPGLLFWCLLFLAVYMAASVLVTTQYFKELRIQETQSALLQQLQRDMEFTRKDLYRAQQQLSMLQDHILGVPEGEPRGHNAEARPPPGQAPPDETLSPPGNRPGVAGKTVVEVKDLAVKQAGMKLEVSFRMVHADAGKGPLRGYVHVIASDRGSAPPQVWTYPKVALREGVPIDYKSGYAFSFRNFITVKGSMFLNSRTDRPSHIHVLAYSESGEPILDRQFEIS